ncbi:MAG TPA: lasso RiPP family leader peptide-containing protein [Terriglobales bacterium]|jgi:hypothetical protein|nr:lasso RiPP family leader peptide-containing protein [Terriglobales bacterium]
MENKTELIPPPASPKKPYHAPVLSSYGDVTEVTKGTGGPFVDGGGGISHP